MASRTCNDDRDETEVARDNSPTENNLLRAMKLCIAAAEAVVDQHDAKDPDGNCGCDICFDVRGGVLWALQIAYDCCRGSLRLLPEEWEAYSQEVMRKVGANDAEACEPVLVTGRSA